MRSIFLLFLLSVSANAVNYPFWRYVPWTHLSYEGQYVAVEYMGYNESTWDVPGTADVEKKTWVQLYRRPLEAAEVLGLTSGDQWDCYINHYFGYDWNSLQMQGLDRPFEALGWTQDSWEGSAPPPATMSAMWADLTPAEISAATQVCYFEQIWDKKNILTWASGGGGSSAGSFSGSGSGSSSSSSNSSSGSISVQTKEAPTIQSDAPSLMPSDAPSLAPSSAPSTKAVRSRF